MSRFVIVAYRPKPGQAAALDALLEKHWRVLNAEALVTAREPVMMRAADGTVVEVFEWASAAAVAAAHSNAAVGALWAEFEAACDYLPIAQVPEAARLFSEFSPLAGATD